MPSAKTPPRPQVDPISPSELGKRLSSFADGLASVTADSPCPWSLGLVYNTLLRLCKADLGADPVVRGLRLLVESRSENGTPVADQSIGTVRVLTQQLVVAVEGRAAASGSK